MRLTMNWLVLPEPSSAPCMRRAKTSQRMWLNEVSLSSVWDGIPHSQLFIELEPHPQFRERSYLTELDVPRWEDPCQRVQSQGARPGRRGWPAHSQAGQGRNWAVSTDFPHGPCLGERFPLFCSQHGAVDNGFLEALPSWRGAVLQRVQWASLSPVVCLAAGPSLCPDSFVC